jgi:PAS domain S-box-containing protein
MKEKWELLPLNTKVTLMVSGLAIIMIGLLGLVVFQSRKNSSMKSNADRLAAHTTDIYNMLDLNHKKISQSIDLAALLTDQIISQAGEITLDSTYTTVTAVNQENQEEINTSLQPLLIDGMQLMGTNYLVDHIREQADVSSTIFQRISEGFLRISTNIYKENQERATGTFIPDSSPVAKALLRGEPYKGRAFVVDQYYITSYKPIVIDGFVEGAVFVGLPEKDLGYLEEKLLGTTYIHSAFPFLVDSKGNMIIHPTSKGANISGTLLFKQLQQQKNGNISYIWPENSKAGQKNRLFFRYYEPYQTYVAITVSEYDYVRKTLQDTLLLILIAILIAAAIFIIAMRMIMNKITIPINSISGTLEKLSLGILVDNFKTNRKDEIGKIANSLNKLINGLKSTALFANEIEKNNFAHDFSPLSEKDVLGNALIDMRKSLEEAFYEDEQRKDDDKKRNWTTEGLAKFGEILRLNNDNLEQLSFNIIKNLVNYLKINQGGLFIINDENESEKFLELTSCYAFDRKKYLSKRIEIGEGLAGACYLEKKSIHLKKIPENYLMITSGLGDAPPQSLLIVPLLLNDQVYGVLELASFKDFATHEIEFVEKIAESIASTLSGVKINMQTAALLEQSQQQSEEMRAQEEEMRQNMEEMQATQEEMARKEAELTGLFNTINDSLLYAELNTNRNFINTNQKLAQLLALTTHEIVGRKHIEINAQSLSQEEYENLWGELLNGKMVNRESHVATQKGNIWLDETYAPVTNQSGEVYKILLIARDITYVKELEMKLKNLKK